MLDRVENLELPRQPPPLSANEPATLVEIYQRVGRDYPKPDTLNFKRDGSWHSLSAEQVLKKANAIALGLYSLGVRNRDRVALLSESRVEWVLAMCAISAAAAVVVPTYPTNSPSECKWVVGNSGAKAVI